MAELYEKGMKYLAPVLGHYTDLEVVSGKGVLLKSLDGKKYLDFTCGVAVNSLGHCHPKVVKAIQKQAATLQHICFAIAYYPSHVNLAEKLAKISPYQDAAVFICQSGSEAVEASLKLAKYVSKKKKILAFTLCFHGRTLGALSVTAKQKYRQGYEDWLIPEVIRENYPYCYRCPFNKKYGSCDFQCISEVEKTILKDTDIAAIIIEPILGEGGYYPAPIEFIQALRKITEEQNILLIFDEVQTGIGRTGTMFALEHYDVVPDIIALAKGMGAGMPIGACIASYSLMKKWDRSAHGGTYPGNPVTCAASLAAIEIIEQENLLENTYQVGQYLKNSLQDIKYKHSFIGDIRGIGLMIGIEIIKPKTDKEPYPELVIRIRNLALKKGLIIISCGDKDQVIRLIPPLNITKAQAETGLNILVDVFNEITNEL